MRLIFLLLTAYFLLLIPFSRTAADEYDDLQKQKEQKFLELGGKQQEVTQTEKRKSGVGLQVSNLKNQILKISQEIEVKKKLIKDLETQRGDKEKQLSQKLALRDRLIQALYKSGRTPSLALFLQSEASGSVFTSLASRLTYYRSVYGETHKKAQGLSFDIAKLKLGVLDNRQLKERLSQEVNDLAAKRRLLDDQLAQLTNKLSQVRGEISSLEGEISRISNRQQQILAEKTGGFQASVGDVPVADDPASRLDFDPGFRPAFAGFSFGAPHRKGMSQYGAFGRAKSGQNYQDILKAYYGNVAIETRELPGSLATTVGNLALEENYLLGIAEMPSRWADEGGFEALKAQVVAARSYALTAGQPICITEKCQVYSKGKAVNPPDAWRRAVNETRGQVVTANGQILSTWYAAASGGYNFSYVTKGLVTSGGWDTKCGNQSCWTGEAYERLANSPWFYKGWYKPRYKAATRSHPWLNQEEFTDIINSINLYVQDSGVVSHLSQTDKANPDTWSPAEVRQRLGGGVVDRVSAVSVIYSQAGFTSNVTVETNKGSQIFDGDTFRQIFNLRAPGELWLASSLFNVEKK